jgi:predicted hydrocarbon binding protein
MKAEIRQNFLSVDKKTARSSYGEFYTIGEEIGHEGAENWEIATIQGFVEMIEQNEIKVFTSKGTCHLDFLLKQT